MQTLSAIQVFLGQLEELHHAETQLAFSLQSLSTMANHPGLRHMIVKHLGDIGRQKRRIEMIFERYGVKPEVLGSAEVRAILEHGRHQLEEAQDPETRDLLLVLQCIRIDHYEMGAYEVTSRFAEQLGLHAESQLLAECLAERDSSVEILRKLQEEMLKLAFPTEVPPDPIFTD